MNEKRAEGYSVSFLANDTDSAARWLEREVGQRNPKGRHCVRLTELICRFKSQAVEFHKVATS